MVTAPLLPESVTRGDTRCSGLHCACVSQRTCVSVHVVIPSHSMLNEYLCFYSYMHNVGSHTFFFFIHMLFFVCMCGCACTEEMFSNSMRCYPSYCLNIPASSTHLQAVALWCVCVCMLATHTYSNGPFSLMY